MPSVKGMYDPTIEQIKSAAAQGEAYGNYARGALQTGSQDAISNVNNYLDQSNKFYEPYYQSGQKALTSLQDLVGFNGSDAQKSGLGQFYQSPGFKLNYNNYDPNQSTWGNFANDDLTKSMFGNVNAGSPDAAYQSSSGYNYLMSEMERAQNASASAGGYLNSPQLKVALQQNAMGLAEQNFNNWQQSALNQYDNSYLTGINNQYNGYLNQLNNLNQGGLSAATNMSNNTNAAGQSIANINTQLGQQLASSFTNQGAQQGSYSMALGQAQTAANLAQFNYQQQQKANSLSAQTTSGGAAASGGSAGGSSSKLPPGYGMVGAAGKSGSWTPEQQQQAAALDAKANGNYSYSAPGMSTFNSSGLGLNTGGGFYQANQNNQGFIPNVDPSTYAALQPGSYLLNNKNTNAATGSYNWSTGGFDNSNSYDWSTGSFGPSGGTSWGGF